MRGKSSGSTTKKSEPRVAETVSARLRLERRSRLGMRLAKDGQRNCYRPRNEDESKAWFWERVIKRGPDECWEWIGSVDGWGYGQMRYNGGHKRVHRLSLMWAGGLPELNNQSVLVLHSCDNKRCVNPRHLHLGDDKQNMREAIERGL